MGCCNDPNYPTCKYKFSLCNSEDEIIESSEYYLNGNQLVQKWNLYLEKAGRKNSSLIKINTGSGDRGYSKYANINLEGLYLFSFKNLVALIHLEYIKSFSIYFREV